MKTYAIASMASALGDPTRRAIFERLSDGPLAVGEIADELPVSRPAVSQHLGVLRNAGLVIDRRVGARRYYQIDIGGVGALRAYFDRFWTKALENFTIAVETDADPDVDRHFSPDINSPDINSPDIRPDINPELEENER